MHFSYRIFTAHTEVVCLRHSLTLCRNTIGLLLFGILLCWASAAAAAQSAGGMLTAQAGANVSSQVSAGVNEGVNGTPGSAPGPSGPAMGLSNRLPVVVQSGEASAEMGVTPAGSNLSINPIRVPDTSTTPHAQSMPQKHHGPGGEGAYAGSGSFPDSTKGAGIISPPDTGTSSSLEWSPSFGFEFPDFQAAQFLKPTLTISGTAVHPLQRSYAPISVAPRSGLKTQLEQPTLHKSIDQQVGLLGAH